MKTNRNFTENDLLYAVATFNADPFCVEDEEMIAGIMNEIEAHGATMITDADEREEALAKLDLPADSQRIIYKAGECLFSMDDDEYTYDVVFNDDTDCNNKGFAMSLDDCKHWIETEMKNSCPDDYFKSYRGGSVSIFCNETEEVVFETNIH